MLPLVRENSDEFERTGSWSAYLKPGRTGASPNPTRKRSARKGEEESEEDIKSEDEDGDSWKESDEDFMPEANLLNASYSEIDEAEDADRMSREKRKSRGTSTARGSSKKQRTKKESPRKKRRTAKDAKKGLASLLTDIADEYDDKPYDTKRARKTTSRSKRKNGATSVKRAKPRVRTQKSSLKDQLQRGVSDSEAEKSEKKRSSEWIDQNHCDMPTLCDPAPRKRKAANQHMPGMTRNERVHKRKFSGYNTRSKHSAGSGSTESEDKLIRIDPPPTRKRRKSAASSTRHGAKSTRKSDSPDATREEDAPATPAKT